jgi:transcriptional regulator with XRE-family HTH domain
MHIKDQKPTPLTQEGLASKIQFLGLSEMDKHIISRIELGERRVIDHELRYISEALGVSIDWLLGDTDDPTPTTTNRIMNKELPNE